LALTLGSSLGPAGVHATSTAGTLGAVSLGAVGKSLVGGALVSFLALTTIDRALSTAPAREVRASSVHARERESALPPAPATSIEGAAESSPPAVPAASASNAPDRPSSRLTRLAPSDHALPVIEPPSRAAFEAVASAEQPPSTKMPAKLSLAAEIRALDQTRSALEAGDTERASALLDHYDSTRPSAVLAQEAALLRVRLLLKQGRRPAAAELARRIIHEHPESAHVDSLRQLAEP
jgi:TolA-binding protein